MSPRSRRRARVGADASLRLLLWFRLRRSVERDRFTDQGLECGRVDVFTFVDVDGTTRVAFEARVEEAFRILQRRALQEGELDDALVRLARTDDAVMRPDGSPHPL